MYGIRIDTCDYREKSNKPEGVTVDLVKMNEFNLDMKSKTVTLQGGAQWSHAFKQLVNGRHDEYIINSGRFDPLNEATIVTADGNLVTVGDSNDFKSDKADSSGHSGAVGCNFGVVVELKMNVAKLQSKDRPWMTL